MSSGVGARPPLPDQVKRVAWRIFGEGESPLNGRSSYDLIRSIVEHHVAVADRNMVIREIQGWFESHGKRHWLRSEIQERVAEVILDGIGPAYESETAVWAVGSMNAGLAASMIRSNWPASAIKGFVHSTLGTLKTACDRNKVLDASRGFGLGLDSTSGEISADAFAREGRIATFQHLVNQGLRFVVGGLHPAVSNLIELSMALRPDILTRMIKELDHPVVQARAAQCAVEAARLLNHRTTLDWIRADACPAEIALAIVHSLETVNVLDDDVQFSGREGVGGDAWATELRPPGDDFNLAGKSLLAGLADRLFELRPQVCAQWIGELLAAAPGSLRSHGADKPPRAQQLETACTEVLVRLVHQSWSGDLPEILSNGLHTGSSGTSTRHLGDLAWALRESAPKRAARIARVALRRHEIHVAQVLEHNLPMLDLRYWDHRECIDGLGRCLAISDHTLDLRKWVVDRCRQLPLSVWDADAQEDHRQFTMAERVAQHWFLLAFHAVPRFEEVGRRVDPAAILSLTETFCDHCHYVQPYVVGRPASSVAAELAARCAVEFGNPSERWLLSLARHPAAGARILWTLIDQGRIGLGRAGDGRGVQCLDEMIVTELASIASERFGDGTRFELDALEYWGRLWLSVDKIDEAELAALAMLEFPARLTRTDTILALKLLALVAGKRGLKFPIRDRLRSLYRELWSVFTPNEERLDREQVDGLLKGLP